MYTCPVCFYDRLEDPAKNYNICPCCGTEFEIDDEYASHEELRKLWIDSGAKWWFKIAPKDWNSQEQIKKGLSKNG